MLIFIYYFFSVVEEIDGAEPRNYRETKKVQRVSSDSVP